jgi:DNA-binding protein YbaB
MFDSFKKIKELKELSDMLEKEKIEIEKNGIKVIVNGKMEVEEIKLNPVLSKEEQEKILKDCINEAARKIQISLAQKMPGLM